MKRIGFLLFVLAILFSSCKKNPNAFTISGNIEGAAGKKIVLKRIMPKKQLRKDSVIIDNEMNFNFEGDVNYPSFYLLSINNEQHIYLLIKPGETVSVSGKYDNLTDQYTIVGSEDSEMIKEVNARYNNTLLQIDSLARVFRANNNNPRLDTVKEKLDIAYEQITGDYKYFVTEYIEENPQSLVCLLIMAQSYDAKNYVLNTHEDFELFKLVDSTLYSNYPESEFVLSLHQKVNELNKMFSIAEKNKQMLGVGSKAPEIDLKNHKGERVLLSSVKGKYVLLNFWASWSRESLNENDLYKKLYKKYHPKGFEIYQVSLDKNEKAWKSAIDRDSLEWINVSDLKFWDSPVAEAYKVQSLPAVFLLNKKGEVISRDLRGENLERELKKIFKY